MSSGPARVLLVGFMGSGKTTVGRNLADALGWPFLDLDHAVEADQGVPVPEIFSRHGEGRFRALEERIAREILERTELVLATGGGWAAAPGRLEGVPPGTLSIWLRVSPEEAVRRARSDMEAADGWTEVERETGGALEGRPLLDVPDPVRRAEELLEEREAAYRKADWIVDTDGRGIDEIVNEILVRLDET